MSNAFLFSFSFFATSFGSLLLRRSVIAWVVLSCVWKRKGVEKGLLLGLFGWLVCFCASYPPIATGKTSC